MNQGGYQVLVEDKSTPADRLAVPFNPKYWLSAAYISFLAWSFHSYGIRFLFTSIHRLTMKFL